MFNGYMSTLATVHPGRPYEKDGEVLYSDARALSVYELFIVMSIPLDWPVPDWVDDPFYDLLSEKESHQRWQKTFYRT